jgi:hypothetical protein
MGTQREPDVGLIAANGEYATNANENQGQKVVLGTRPLSCLFPIGNTVEVGVAGERVFLSSSAHIADAQRKSLE